MADLVLTLLGPDGPGLVERVADVIAAHGGNWVESRMSHLAGKFAGILRAEVPADRVAAATAALQALETRGLKVIVEAAARAGAAPDGHDLELDLVGLDRPGIVREISQLLALNGVNVEELTTNRVSAPMSAEMLFQARAHVRVSPETDVTKLRAELERLASDLVVEVKLTPAELDAGRR